MASLNKVQLIGNLGQDPKMRYLPDGTAVASVRVATSDSYLNSKTGALVKATEWHHVVFFDRLAEIAAGFLEKGSTIYVEGKTRTRKWSDKDGVERYISEVRAGELILLGGKNKKKGSTDQSSAGGTDHGDAGQDSELPY